MAPRVHGRQASFRSGRRYGGYVDQADATGILAVDANALQEHARPGRPSSGRHDPARALELVEAASRGYSQKAKRIGAGLPGGSFFDRLSDGSASAMRQHDELLEEAELVWRVTCEDT